MTMHHGPGWINRVIWIALGIFFAGLTGMNLLHDVQSFSQMKPDHWMTIGAMVGAVAAGLYFGPCVRNRHLGIATFMAISAITATIYCLVGSAGRGDEAAFEKNAEARQINRDRARAERDRDEAKQRWQQAAVAETSECSQGVGRYCIAKRSVTEAARRDFEISELLLQKAKPEQRENGKLKRASEIVAFFGKTDVKTAEQGLTLVWPFIPPTICELLTIAFFHLGLAPARRRKVKDQRKQIEAETIVLNAETVSRETEIVSPDTETIHAFRVATPLLEAEVKGYVLQAIEMGAVPSQAAVAKRYNIHRATISRWFIKWEQEGVILRSRIGRRNEITTRH